MSDVTRILATIEQGDAGAAEELLPIVYEELRRLAAQKLSREPCDQTVQATALVHEAYIRLVGSDNRHSGSEEGGDSLRTVEVPDALDRRTTAAARTRLWRGMAATWMPGTHSGRRLTTALGDEAMRRILLDQARRKQRLKHGGGRERLDLNVNELATGPASDDLLALDEALAKLAGEDRIKADLVKLRYFAGLTLVEAGEMLGLSRATADRYWAYARAWLYHEITKGD